MLDSLNGGSYVMREKFKKAWKWLGGFCGKWVINPINMAANKFAQKLSTSVASSRSYIRNAWNVCLNKMRAMREKLSCSKLELILLLVGVPVGVVALGGWLMLLWHVLETWVTAGWAAVISESVATLHYVVLGGGGIVALCLATWRAWIAHEEMNFSKQQAEFTKVQIELAKQRGEESKRQADLTAKQAEVAVESLQWQRHAARLWGK